MQSVTSLTNPALFNEIMTEPIPTIKTPSPAVSDYQLSTQAYIAALEAELFNLKVHHQPDFVPIIKMRRQAEAEWVHKPIRTEQTVPRLTALQAEQRDKTPVLHRLSTPEVATALPLRKSPIPECAPSERPLVQPKHPFHSAKDATYAPPQSRDVRAPEKVPARKTEPAY